MVFCSWRYIGRQHVLQWAVDRTVLCFTYSQWFQGKYFECKKCFYIFSWNMLWFSGELFQSSCNRIFQLSYFPSKNHQSLSGLEKGFFWSRSKLINVISKITTTRKSTWFSLKCILSKTHAEMLASQFPL